MRNFSVDVVSGKLTDQKADMLVNSSNTFLLLGSGTAKDIREAGGYLARDDVEYLALKLRLGMENPTLGKVLDYIDSTERLPSKAQNMRLRYILENKARELKLGDAVLFPIGDLEEREGMAKYVSDAVGMSYIWGIQPFPPIVPATFYSVKDSVKKSLDLAAKSECKNVAIPVMCTRKGGLTKETSSLATAKALQSFDRKKTSVENVSIVLYSKELEDERKWYEEFYRF